MTISIIRKFLGRSPEPWCCSRSRAWSPTSPAQPAEPGRRRGIARPGQRLESVHAARARGQVRRKRSAPAKQARRPGDRQPIPQGCADMSGVERKICVECDGVAFFKRIGCQQRVFWTTCKGKRLFEDGYCQMHQEKGPPGESN